MASPTASSQRATRIPPPTPDVLRATSSCEQLATLFFKAIPLLTTRYWLLLAGRNGVGFVRSVPLQVASKTNDAAGDGTTSATVLTRAIFREGCKVRYMVQTSVTLFLFLQHEIDFIPTRRKIEFSFMFLLFPSSEVVAVACPSWVQERYIVASSCYKVVLSWAGGAGASSLLILGARHLERRLVSTS